MSCSEEVLISDRISHTWEKGILRPALEDEKTSAKPLIFLLTDDNHTKGGNQEP